MIGGVFDLVIAAVLGLLMTAYSVQTPVSQTTRQYEAMQQLVPMLQSAVRTAEVTANSSGTAGVNDNDGATIAFSGTTMSTAAQVYSGRPIGSATLPAPHVVMFNQAITINGGSPPYGIFVAPSGVVNIQSGWTPGSSVAAASSCTTITFTAGSATVTMDCLTGAVTGP